MSDERPEACTKCGAPIVWCTCESGYAPPKTIYLQRLSNDITWCSEKVYEDDIEYIQKAEYDAAWEALKKIRELANYDIDHEEDGNTYQIEAIASAVLKENK